MGLEGNYYQHLTELYPQRVQFLNWIKLSLDNQVYNYGDHLKMPIENIRLKYLVKKNISYLKHHFLDLWNVKKQGGYNRVIISNAYSSLNDSLSGYGNVPVMPMPWSYGIDIFSRARFRRIIYKLNHYSVNQLLDEKFYGEILYLYEQMKSFLDKNQIRMVICYNDMYPLERMVIDAGKELGIPTAVFLHGLPGRYNSVDDNRADYLFVWGEGIKTLCEKAGIESKKIIVAGHPFYSAYSFPSLNINKELFPLIITYVSGGVPSNSEEYEITDRGNSIAYAWCVEEALKRIGVTHATIRPHPSESPKWYKRNIDLDFYEIDSETLSESIKGHSFIIGPTSTMIIDAAVKGVPYFGFSPFFKYSSPLVPPFDNSENDFPVARTVEELAQNISSARFMQSSVLNKYIAPFIPDVILSLAKKS